MRSRAAVLAATLFALLLALPAAGANFTNPTSNDANAFTSDTLAPPTGLTAACGTTITLDWTATVDTYATGHRVFRATTPGGPYSQIAEVTPRTTVTYDDTPAAGTYYYVVRAYYQSWESVDSNEVEGETTWTFDATFSSIADTWADESKPNDNHGTDTTMIVRSWQTGKDERSFVEFDVSSIPAGSTVDSATLTLCATAVPAATRTYDLHRVTASWVETSLTWNNQPTVAGAATASATTPGSPGCMSWTVTADVQLWVDGTANEGWRAKDSVEGQGTKYITEFATRENGTPTDRPVLDVNYTEPLVFDNADSVTADATGSTISAFTVTGTDTLLTVGVQLRDDDALGVTVSGVTFDGTPLAVVSGGTAETCTGGDRVRTEIWMLKGASGTGDIVVTLTGQAHHSAGAISFAGVDQTTPIADVATAVGQSPSAGVTSEAAGMGRDAVTQRTNGAISADTGQTERYNVTTTKHAGGGSTEPGAASVTMGWTTNATCSALVVTAIAPAL